MYCPQADDELYLFTGTAICRVHCLSLLLQSPRETTRDIFRVRRVQLDIYQINH